MNIFDFWRENQIIYQKIIKRKIIIGDFLTFSTSVQRDFQNSVKYVIRTFQKEEQKSTKIR